MDSDFEQQQYQHHFQEFPRQFHHQKQQTNSLTRFRSAPSSYFASFLDVAADTINTTGGARPLSPETENIFASFMSSFGAENSAVAVRIKQETDIQQQQQSQQQVQQSNCKNQSQMIYHSQSKPPLSNQHNSAMQKSFTAAIASSMGMDSINNNNNNSSLTRHSSSPAGFFANLNIHTSGYGMMGGTGNYGGDNGGNFSSGQPTSSTGLMNQSSDIVANTFSNSSNNDKDYGFPITSSWDDSVLSENFAALDRVGEDSKTFSELNASENQSAECKNRPPILSHHLSLPKTLPDLSNFLQFQDTVPCRIRAKRGCATHPRSIAERVRRTKISERMRKLQDLVPNIDKQTNTADMLDLAADYIKDLQKQVENLNDNRAKCTCSR